MFLRHASKNAEFPLGGTYLEPLFFFLFFGGESFWKTLFRFVKNALNHPITGTLLNMSIFRPMAVRYLTIFFFFLFILDGFSKKK